MKRLCAFLLSGALCGSLLAQVPSPPPQSQLRWKNGQMLPGEILGADANQLTWKTPLFEEPLALDWKALRRIDQSVPSTQTGEVFSFTARNGSFFYGNLVEITGETFLVRSARHGDLRVRKDALLCVRRLGNAASQPPGTPSRLIVSGPQGTTGWTAPNLATVEGLPIQALVAGPGGSLRFPYWNTRASSRVAPPSSGDLELTFSEEEKQPEFEWVLVGQEKSRISVETWENEVVLRVGDTFRKLCELEPTVRRVPLRITWDLDTRVCTLVRLDRPQTAELTWAVPVSPPNPTDQPTRLAPAGSETPLAPGFHIRNKGRALTLESFQLRSGLRTGNSAGSGPRVELADGRVLAGQVQTLPDNTLGVSAEQAPPAAPFPWDAVEKIILSDDPPIPVPHEMTFAYGDGAFLRGTLSAQAPGRMSLQTPFCEVPIPVPLDGLSQVRPPVPSPVRDLANRPEMPLDQIELDQTPLSGRLITAGNADPQWLPVGGVRPATPSHNVPYRIRRGFGLKNNPNAPSALIHTRSGDILAATLEAITPSGIAIRSPQFESRTLPRDSVEGIRFATTTQKPVKGFRDGWTVVKGNEKDVQRTKNLVTIQPGATLWHASAMASKELHFKIEGTDFSTVRLQVFADASGEKSTAVIIGRMGEHCTVKGDGPDSPQVQLATPLGVPLAVQITIDPGALQIRINGVTLTTIPVKQPISALGLRIEPGSLWGNQQEAVTLSDFSGVANPAQLPVVAAAPEAKKQALTVPRFRRETPPSHVLIASNGDLLTGTLESATSSHIQFRTGLESLAIPRERLSAAIWLKKRPPSTDATTEENATIKALAKPFPTSNLFGDLTSHLSFLKRADQTLVFQTPENFRSPKRRIQIQQATLQSALESICAAFGLSFRVAESGQILLEPSTSGGANLAHFNATYWLKKPAFKDATAARHEIAKQGVALSESAPLLWEPAFQQLTLSSSGANLDKIHALLETAHGGVRDRATHTLVLTNGARITLKATAFSENTIDGQHPFYGRCSIPTSEVFELSRRHSEPGGLRNSLGVWEWEPAREPVIAGAESSAALAEGKPAPNFKLPLLSGGEFELSSQKGKVLVLDFWATWCGPCIQSIPEWIEALSVFPESKVQLMGVNQGEPSAAIQSFLRKRGWNFTVALDASQSVGKTYGADSIPHTVIVGPDGNIVWSQTGHNASGTAEAVGMIRKLLGETPPATEPR
jgi:peroxiredoxin